METTAQPSFLFNALNDDEYPQHKMQSGAPDNMLDSNNVPPSSIDNGAGNKFLFQPSQDDSGVGNKFLFQPASQDNYAFSFDHNAGPMMMDSHSLMNSAYTSAYSSMASSPVLGMERQSMTVPNSPTHRNLTAGQKASLASLKLSTTFAPQQQQSYQQGPNSAVPNATLLQHGIDTSQMSEEALRQLASQMQSISSSTAAEIRRQLHITSEQKRRLQIKGGFDELRAEIPGLEGEKKMSKAMVLSRACEYLARIRGERQVMITEIERLREENRRLMDYCEFQQ